jgi:hypothetical protein
VPDLRITPSDRFRSDTRELLGDERWQTISSGFEWTLRRSAELGQKVRGTQDLRVYPIYPGDGHVYIVYYRILGDEIILKSMVKRHTPVSPRVLDFED